MEKQLGKYRVKKVLGQGSYGKVYLVADETGKEYAAKVMQLTQKQLLSQVTEAILQLSLNHQHLLKAYDVIVREEEKDMIIIMDVCQQSVADLIGTNWLRTHPADAQRLMLEMALGIRHMHAAKVAHRDIKPENILIKDMHAKISDYGLSKVITSFAATKAGTPLYIAPELLLTNAYGIGVDVWSLGIVFIEILLDKRIYELLAGMELPCRRADFPSRELVAALPSDAARNLIVAMLKRDPKDRPDINEVVDFMTKNDMFKEKAGSGGAQQANKPNLYMIGTDEGVYLVAVQGDNVAVLGRAPKQKQPERVQNAPTAPKQKVSPYVGQQDVYPPSRSPPPPRPPPRQPSPAPRNPSPAPRQYPAYQRRDIVLDINNPLIEGCEHCQYNTQSITEHRSGWVFWGWCCCLLVTVPPLVCVPLCVDRCKDRDVFCAECGNLKKEVKAKCCG